MKENQKDAERIKEIYRQIGDNIATGITDALTDAAMGAKTLGEALSNVLQNLQRQLIEMAIQSAVGGLGGVFSGFFTNIFGRNKNIPKLAKGGSARAGIPHLVGERGPELFTPSRSGTVTPNHALGGTTNVVVNVDASGSSVEGDADQAEQLGNRISEAIQAELIAQKRAGGLLYN